MKPFIVFLLLFWLASAPAPAQKKSKSVPCANAGSQADMNDCAGREYKAADTTLNQVYRQLVSLLDDEEKLQLKEAQTAWLKYRDANCEFVGGQYKGGTMRPMVHAMCLADMTSSRTGELKVQINDRSR